MSDGIADSAEDAPWLLLLLGDPPKKNLKEYATLILNEAKINSKSSDDMSITVIRVDEVQKQIYSDFHILKTANQKGDRYEDYSDEFAKDSAPPVGQNFQRRTAKKVIFAKKQRFCKPQFTKPLVFI